jgi:hypothetical protein
MAYLTINQALAASPAQRNARLVEAELRKAASSSPRDARFDIFLSHASEDARVIAGVKALLESEGLAVYVDWVEDTQLSRAQVDAATAALLRLRMNHSGYLLYASSTSSSSSKWMPWELGYFDGRRPGHVGVLPLVRRSGEGFRGVEYVGLYPFIELVNFRRDGTRFGHFTGTSQADALRTMATAP